MFCLKWSLTSNQVTDDVINLTLMVILYVWSVYFYLYTPFAKSCYVSVIGMTSMNKTFVKNSLSDLTVQDCINNLPAGNHTVYVYDVENNIPLTSILLPIILRDIVITDVYHFYNNTDITPTVQSYSTVVIRSTTNIITVPGSQSFPSMLIYN